MNHQKKSQLKQSHENPTKDPCWLWNPRKKSEKSHCWWPYVKLNPMENPPKSTMEIARIVKSPWKTCAPKRGRTIPEAIGVLPRRLRSRGSRAPSCRRHLLFPIRYSTRVIYIRIYIIYIILYIYILYIIYIYILYNIYINIYIIYIRIYVYEYSQW